MQAIANYDQKAFTELVTRHLDSLFAYALRLSGSTQQAEDLVQDTWLTVWQKAFQYQPGKVRPTTWLHKVLHNRYIDMVRKKTPIYVGQPVSDSPYTTEESANFEDDAELQLRFATYTKALQTLPEAQRAALLLAHVQGFSNKEVATILGVSVRAVESLQARARRTLQNADTAIGRDLGTNR